MCQITQIYEQNIHAPLKGGTQKLYLSVKELASQKRLESAVPEHYTLNDQFLKSDKHALSRSSSDGMPHA